MSALTLSGRGEGRGRFGYQLLTLSILCVIWERCSPRVYSRVIDTGGAAPSRRLYQRIKGKLVGKPELADRARSDGRFRDTVSATVFQLC